MTSIFRATLDESVRPQILGLSPWVTLNNDAFLTLCMCITLIMTSILIKWHADWFHDKYSEETISFFIQIHAFSLLVFCWIIYFWGWKLFFIKFPVSIEQQKSNWSIIWCCPLLTFCSSISIEFTHSIHFTFIYLSVWVEKRETHQACLKNAGSQRNRWDTEKHQQMNQHVQECVELSKYTN